ncbi:MAG: M24 family metallopeptidase [Pirellulaceae bacterium]|nr:aminopeptidase P family protein [Planctomycetales bacterium]
MPNSVERVARVMAGIPSSNASLYREIRFLVGDPAAMVELPIGGGTQRMLILRDIEMGRAARHARVDRVHCPVDFTPSDGLSGDRETATAQAVAECLRRNDVTHVVADRSLPLIYVHQLQQAGIWVECDPEWGVLERRSKDAQEIVWLREAQATTEGAIEMACRMVARSTAAADGSLQYDGAPLTSERIRAAVSVWLLERGYTNSPSIIAGGPEGADCHNLGQGTLRTGTPVIIDIFPRCDATRYHGDCTRTVVHGDVPDEVLQMHAAVVAAKQMATRACRAGATGEHVHEATAAEMTSRGYHMGRPPGDASKDYCGMPHGTGHGIGLDVHEPPLLDRSGPVLVVGDALTIEPGLYCDAIGGVRVEDMVIVTADGCTNLNQLPEGLDWT